MRGWRTSAAGLVLLLGFVGCGGKKEPREQEGPAAEVVAPDVMPERLWDVLSMINGNFASVFDSEDPCEALKEAIRQRTGPSLERGGSRVKWGWLPNPADDG